jgi:hypothetical protein
MPHSKPWYEADDCRLIELRRAKRTRADIAKAMGRSEEAVRQRLLGINLRIRVKLLKRKYSHMSQPLASSPAERTPSRRRSIEAIVLGIAQPPQNTAAMLLIGS